MIRQSQFARLQVVVIASLALGACFRDATASAQVSSLPRVVLQADAIAPRPIEQRTGETVTHDYAQAWQDLAESLADNRADLLNEYFTGGAKDRLAQRISEQRQIGLQTRFTDRGHKVTAVFYSRDGGEMQLEDEAQIEVQVFDGSTMIYSDNSTRKFLVLMTPGADRWYVRSLESVGDDAF